MDITSPGPMTTKLLDVTRSSLVSLLTKSLEELSQDEKKSIGDLLCEYGLTQLDQEDLADILKWIIHYWYVIKENLFDCNNRNGNGASYRTYVGIMLNARNEWAHNFSLTYDDVLFTCYAVQRFFSETKKQIDVSMVDQIIEACHHEISGKYLKTLSPTDGLQEIDLASSITDAQDQERTLIHGQDGETEKSEIIKPLYEDELNLEGDLEFENIDLAACEEEEFIEEDGEEDEEGVRLYKELQETLSDVKAIIEAKDYTKLITRYNLPETTVEEGEYLDTLYIYGAGTWGSWGWEKLEWVEDHLFDVFLFAQFDFCSPNMVGDWNGNKLICIPSSADPRVKFGRNKARMLCASMDRISVWLKNYSLS